jgi:hypothetical protein
MRCWANGSDNAARKTGRQQDENDAFFHTPLHIAEAKHIGRFYGKNRRPYGKNLTAIFEL